MAKENIKLGMVGGRGGKMIEIATNLINQAEKYCANK